MVGRISDRSGSETMTEVQYEEDLERAAEGGGSQCVREKGRERESTAAVVHANKVIMSILKPEDADC